MSEQRKDNWAAGNLYEPYVGRWSRLVAKDFLQWLALPAQLDWLDVGCGTGALTQTILQADCNREASRGSTLRPDLSTMQRRIPAIRESHSKWVMRSRFQWNPRASMSAASGLVLNFVPKPSLAAQEMTRAVRSGGVVAAYVWDYAGKMELMRYFWDASNRIGSSSFQASTKAFAFRFANRLLWFRCSLTRGCAMSQSREIDVPTTFRDFDDYWNPFLGGQGPAPGYAMSLSEERRNVLRDRIRAMLPIASDGSIPLIARAWAVRGRRP